MDFWFAIYRLQITDLGRGNQLNEMLLVQLVPTIVHFITVLIIFAGPMDEKKWQIEIADKRNSCFGSTILTDEIFCINRIYINYYLTISYICVFNSKLFQNLKYYHVSNNDIINVYRFAVKEFKAHDSKIAEIFFEQLLKTSCFEIGLILTLKLG